MTRIVSDGTVVNPRFPQEQHTALNRVDDDLSEDIYREFIDSFGMIEAFEKFRAERARSRYDMDTELSEGPGQARFEILKAQLAIYMRVCICMRVCKSSINSWHFHQFRIICI